MNFSKQDPDKNQEVDLIRTTISQGSNENKHFTYDKEERKRRLESGTKLRDVLVVLCAGFALISDGYQNNVMTMLNKVFAVEYPKEYTDDMKTSVSNASLVGTIFGQVAVGFACDYMGRKWAIVCATIFLILGTIMCAASHGKTVEGMFWMLIISRGVTGFGIGAEYPSSSVSANEAANESIKRRGGTFVMCTNFPLAFGGPFALIVFLIVRQITKEHLEGLWRTMFAVGAFFPLSVFYFRMKMSTSELYKRNAIKKRVPYWLAIKFHWKRLLGTCLCWFLYDFVTFPNGIFSATIISSVLNTSEQNNLDRIAEWNLLLSIIAIPGVFVGAYLCDRIGRKYTMIVGFSGYIVFGLIVGCAFDKIKNITGLFIVFYGLMMCSGNLGPGDMMGLVSLESFATPVRATCYGISAAIGKVGAVVGTRTFSPIQTKLGNRWTFIIAAICGLSGVICAFLFIPHLRDEDLLEQDYKFNNYLIDNGWEGNFGTEDDARDADPEAPYDIEYSVVEESDSNRKH